MPRLVEDRGIWDVRDRHGMDVYRGCRRILQWTKKLASDEAPKYLLVEYLSRGWAAEAIMQVRSGSGRGGFS